MQSGLASIVPAVQTKPERNHNRILLQEHTGKKSRENIPDYLAKTEKPTKKKLEITAE